MALIIVYLANIIVAGYIGITSLFFPKMAGSIIFQNLYPNSDLVRLVGCLWLAIAILSGFGLFKPVTFSPVLLLQLIYKGTWLLVVALPAIRAQKEFPSGMATFFLVWVLLLPFVVPWAEWIKK